MAIPATVRENKASYSSNTPLEPEPQGAKIPTSWLSPSTFTITLPEGRTVEVKFVPDLAGAMPMHQFDLRGPVSPTGFQSHFVLAVEAETGWATPTDYALDYAMAIITKFEEEQFPTSHARSRSQTGATTTPEPTTDRDNPSKSTRSETTDGYLAIRLICTDGGTQSRAALNEETIEEYAEAMDAGAFFPPVTVFYDGEEYWLADGFHRVAAAKKLEWTDIAVEILQGSRREAVLHSVGANATHGLRRTNADKRRAVITLLRDEEWSRWSNREIAKLVGVAEGLVRKIKEELSAYNTQIDLDFAKKCGFPVADLREVQQKLACEEANPERTVERHGKTYTQNTANIGKKAKKTRIAEHFKQEDTYPPPIPYQVGSVVEIRAGCNPTLRSSDGMWGIVTHVGSFSCTVHISLRNVNVQCKPDEMDPVDPKYTQKIQEVSDRVAALTLCDLDPAAWSILETLNKQICFTQFQLDLLAWVEERYGIKTYNN